MCFVTGGKTGKIRKVRGEEVESGDFGSEIKGVLLQSMIMKWVCWDGEEESGGPNSPVCATAWSAEVRGMRQSACCIYQKSQQSLTAETDRMVEC